MLRKLVNQTYRNAFTESANSTSPRTRNGCEIRSSRRTVECSIERYVRCAMRWRKLLQSVWQFWSLKNNQSNCVEFGREVWSPKSVAAEPTVDDFSDRSHWYVTYGGHGSFEVKASEIRSICSQVITSFNYLCGIPECGHRVPFNAFDSAYIYSSSFETSFQAG